MFLSAKSEVTSPPCWNGPPGSREAVGLETFERNQVYSRRSRRVLQFRGGGGGGGGSLFRPRVRVLVTRSTPRSRWRRRVRAYRDLGIDSSHVNFMEPKLERKIFSGAKLTEEEVLPLAIISMSGVAAEALTFDEVSLGHRRDHSRRRDAVERIGVTHRLEPG